MLARPFAVLALSALVSTFATGQTAAQNARWIAGWTWSPVSNVGHALLATADSGDRLHPSDAGYAAMAEAIPLNVCDPGPAR